MMKRGFDLVFGSCLLVVLAPVAGVAALAVRIETRGSALFRAQRVGRGGRTFTMWKLRTMTSGSGGPPLTTSGDGRITRVGRVLRALHVDEIPQLWNVVRGEMSLVGPRPEAPELVDPSDARWQRVLTVRPGLTGPAQLRFAHTETALLAGPDPVRSYRERVLPEKLAIDAAYVDGRSLAGDLACLLRTAARVVRRSSA